MTLTLDEDEILSAAIAGVSKVAELIATVPAEERTRALEAAKRATSKPRTSGLPRRRRSTVGFCSDVAIANRRRQPQAADADFPADFAELTDFRTAVPILVSPGYTPRSGGHAALPSSSCFSRPSPSRYDR